MIISIKSDIIQKISRRNIMALSVNKDGKVFEKRLTMDEDIIRKIISNRDKEHHKKVLQRAMKIKIVRRVAL
jgi:mevalonate pyrophosphate decarboxylase